MGRSLVSPNPAAMILEDVKVRGNVTISGITVTGASAQETARSILDAMKHAHEDESSAREERKAIQNKLYAYATLYIDIFRELVLVEEDASGADDIQNFLVKYVETLREHNARTFHIIEVLTSLGMLHRIHGQYLQLMTARNEEAIFSCNFYFHRKNLTQERADRGHFAEAETHLREALKLCIDKFGIEHRQILIIGNEIGLLHRDRGEYKQAIRQFRLTMSHLNTYHPSESYIQSMLYLNWATAYREISYNFWSLYYLWGSRIFNEATLGGAFPVTEEYRVQKRYNIAFISIKLFIYIIWTALYFLVLLSAMWVGIKITISLVLALLISAIGVKITKFALFRILIIPLAAWIEGIRVGLEWPSRSRSETLGIISYMYEGDDDDVCMATKVKLVSDYMAKLDPGWASPTSMP